MLWDLSGNEEKFQDSLLKLNTGLTSRIIDDSCASEKLFLYVAELNFKVHNFGKRLAFLNFVMRKYGNALNIVRAVQYLFPINFANKITFNTRATSYNPSAKINLSVFEGERATGCTFGSVEVLQFYDESRSVCDTKGCDYYFFYNQNMPVKTLLPSIKRVETVYLTETANSAATNLFSTRSRTDI